MIASPLRILVLVALVATTAHVSADGSSPTTVPTEPPESPGRIPANLPRHLLTDSLDDRTLAAFSAAAVSLSADTRDARDFRRTRDTYMALYGSAAWMRTFGRLADSAGSTQIVKKRIRRQLDWSKMATRTGRDVSEQIDPGAVVALHKHAVSGLLRRRPNGRIPLDFENPHHKAFAAEIVATFNSISDSFQETGRLIPFDTVAAELIDKMIRLATALIYNESWIKTKVRKTPRVCANLVLLYYQAWRSSPNAVRETIPLFAAVGYIIGDENRELVRRFVKEIRLDAAMLALPPFSFAYRTPATMPAADPEREIDELFVML